MQDPTGLSRNRKSLCKALQFCPHDQQNKKAVEHPEWLKLAHTSHGSFDLRVMSTTSKVSHACNHKRAEEVGTVDAYANC